MFRPAILTIIAAGLLCAIARAADPAAAFPPHIQRTPSQALKDWEVLSEQLRGILPSPAAMGDRERRSQVAPAAIPLLRKAISLNTEIYHLLPDAQPECRRKHYQFLAILALLDDQPAIDELRDAQESNVMDIASLSRRAWYSSRWWKASGDDPAALVIIDELEKLSQEAPDDDSLAGLLLSFRQEGLATPAQDRRIRQILERMTGPLALAAVEQFKAADKRASLIGKPILITGQTVDGKPFTSKSLAGRPVLVHFGMTSLDLWVQQHNRMLQANWPADLAVVTVLCDETEEPVRAYLERHRAVPWPVLWDKEDPAGFASQYGIEELPNTMLIDSTGRVIATDIAPTHATITDLLPATPAPSSADTTK